MFYNNHFGEKKKTIPNTSKATEQQEFLSNDGARNDSPTKYREIKKDIYIYRERCRHIDIWR